MNILKLLYLIFALSFGVEAADSISLVPIDESDKLQDNSDLFFRQTDMFGNSSGLVVSKDGTRVKLTLRNSINKSVMFRNLNGYWRGVNGDIKKDNVIITFPRTSGFQGRISQLNPGETTTLNLLSSEGYVIVAANNTVSDKDMEQLQIVDSDNSGRYYEYIIPNFAWGKGTSAPLNIRFYAPHSSTGKLDMPDCSVNGIIGQPTKVVCEGVYEGRAPNLISVTSISSPDIVTVTSPVDYQGVNSTKTGNYKIRMPFIITAKKPGQYQIPVQVNVTWP